MAAYNEFLVMNGHNNPGFSDDAMEMSGTQSFYSETMYSDERSPLLICTPTRIGGNHTTKKSSVLYVNKAVLHSMQKPKGSRYS